ncbi:MAG: RICIN domain-containing protein [Chitinophagales bacterium]|nr:RICIN domain-containing protein [Chitinophagales bacterium]
MLQKINFILAIILLGYLPLFSQLRDGEIYHLRIGYGTAYIWPSEGEEADRVLLQAIAIGDHDASKFRWKAISAGDNWFYLQHVNSGLVMTMRNGNRRRGDQIWLQSRNNTDAQKFRFSWVENDLYKLENKLTPYLSVKADLSFQNVLTIDDDNLPIVQRWRLEYAYEEVDAFGRPFNFSRAYKDEDTYLYLQYVGKNTAFGVIEMANETYVFEGSVQPQADGKVFISNKYSAVPKGKKGKEILDRSDNYIDKIIVERNGTAISFVSKRGRRTTLHQLFPHTGNERFGLFTDAGFQADYGIGITGLWKSDDGLTYYIHQLGDKRLVWFAEKYPSVSGAAAHVGIGHWRRQTDEDDRYLPGLNYDMEGNWAAVPKGRFRGRGQVSFAGNMDTMIVVRNIPEGDASFTTTRLFRQRYLQLEITQLNAQSEDACNGMDFYGETRFYGIQRKNHNVLTGNNISPNWKHQGYWKGDRDVPITIVIKDKDDGILCGGGDDMVDINPIRGTDDEERSFNLYLRVKPDGTILHMNKVGNRGTDIGKVKFKGARESEIFEFSGNNSRDSREESADIEFKLTYTYIKEE